MGDLKKGRWRFVATVGFIAAVLGATYLPALTASYGYNDDYHLLARVKSGSFSLWSNETLEQGRPLHGLVYKSTFSLADTIEDIRFVRLIGLAGIMLFAALSFRLFLAAGFPRDCSVALALLICLSPGFAVYAGWATLACAGFVAGTALAGGRLIWVGSGKRLAEGLPWTISGLLLLITSYAVYQPLGQFAAFAILVSAWTGGEGGGQAPWRRFALATGLTLLGAALYFALYRTASALVEFQGQVSRGSLPSDVKGKILFLAGEILPSGFTQWAQFSGSAARWTAAIVVCAACAVALARAGGERRDKGWTAFAAVSLAVMLPLSVLPIAVTVQNSFAFRSQSVLHAVILFVVLAGLQETLGLMALSPARLAVTRSLVCASLVLVSSALAFSHLMRGITEVSGREVALLRSEIRDRFRHFPEKIVYISPPVARVNEKSVAEFGKYSSPLPWVTQSMFDLLFEERFGAGPVSASAVEEGGGPLILAAPGRGEIPPVIDGMRLLHGEPRLIPDDPYWGEVEAYPDDLYASPWFGTFDNSGFPSIYHGELGWLFCSGSGKDSYRFWNAELGWMWTSPTLFPKILIPSRGGWVELMRNIAPGRSLADLQEAPDFAAARGSGALTLSSGFAAGAVDLGGGWHWFDWFGYFNIEKGPWIIHAQHGWMHLFRSSRESIVFWDSAMGAFWWTSDTQYPYVYRFSDGEWLWYQKESGSPRWFVRLSDGEWEQW